MLNRLVRRRSLLPLLSGLLILSLVLTFPHRSIVAQTPLGELQRQQKEVEQKRSTLNDRRDRVQTQENAAKTKLGGIQTRIRATSAQISANEQKLAAANQHLKKLQGELAVTENDYQKKQSATIARLKFLQQQQGIRGWAILLQSQSLNEFLDRRYQLQRVYESDRKTLQSLKTEADKIAQQHRAVANKKNEIALLTQELLVQKSQYQAEANVQQANVNRLKQDRTAMEAAEEQLARDSENLAALIQERLAAQAREQSRTHFSAAQSSGLMGYPCNGPITSSFGNRVHPILGYVRFHSGLDFGDDYGSPIFATNPGVVIFAGWYSGYGQAVIVDHGGGITTLYGHTSALYISEGETVQRGQAIAAIGSSGFSTGPHLHFEVRQDGEPVDPINYF